MTSGTSPITPEACRAFVALLRAGGVLKVAATELGETTPTLSKRLRPLVVGSPPHLIRPWLRKIGKRFLLTEEGTAMLPAATDLADRWDRLRSDAERTRRPGLTVACGQEAAGGVVLAAAARFRTTHPVTPLRIAVVRGRKRIEGLAGGQYDLALVTNNKSEIEAVARRKVAVRQLAEDTLVLACAAKSEWAKTFADGAEVTAAQLKDWPFVLPETDAAVRQEWDDRLAKVLPHPPSSVIEVGGWRVLLGYVLAGFGVGLLPSSVANDAGSKVRTRPLADAIRPRNHLRVITLPNPSNAELVADFAAGLE